MKTSAAEASSVKAPAVEAAKTGLSSEGISSRIAAVIESAEGARVHSSRNVWRVGAVKALMPAKAPAT
jgi:hypothetical protein